MCGDSVGLSKAAQLREREYKGEDDHRTLTRAAEIAGDADRMKFVARHHKKTQKGLARVGKLIGGRR